MREWMFLSECGGYVCRSHGGGNYEAWTVDGATHWKHDDRVKTWADAKRFRHPLPYGVGGYSAEKTGQKPGSFTLNLLKCNTRMKIKPFTGNTIIESRDVVFRRKVNRGHVASWLRKLNAKPLTVAA